MTVPIAIVLLACALLVVLVRRRSLAIIAVSVQSVLLGAIAIEHAAAGTPRLAAAGAILVLKGVLLPIILARTVRGARELRPVAERLHALPRVAIALGLGLITVWAVGDVGFEPRFAGSAAVALLGAGVAIAVLRPATLFQALGFIVAENGVYLAALSVPAGMPVLIEIGLVFDLVLIVSCAALFTTSIHHRFGSADTELMRELRDR